MCGAKLVSKRRAKRPPLSNEPKGLPFRRSRVSRRLPELMLHGLLLRLVLVLATVLACGPASAGAETRVGGFGLVATAFVRVQSLRNPNNHRTKSIAPYDYASGYALAAEGAGITRGEQVTESVVREAMKDAPLMSQQRGGISLPRVQQYVERLLAGGRASYA